MRVAQRGSLKDIPIAELILELVRSGSSGILEVTHGKLKRQLALSNGIPIAIQSNGMSESITRLLEGAGRLSADQSASLLQRMRSLRRPLESLVVEEGLVTPEELSKLVTVQNQVRLMGLYLVEEGEYSFEERSLPNGPSIGLPAAVLQLVKKQAGQESLLRSLESRRKERPRALASPCFSLDEFGLSEEELELFRSLDGKRELGEVLLFSGMKPNDVAVLIQTWTLTGMIEDARTALSAQSDAPAIAIAPPAPAIAIAPPAPAIAVAPPAPAIAIAPPAPAIAIAPSAPAIAIAPPAPAIAIAPPAPPASAAPKTDAQVRSKVPGGEAVQVWGSPESDGARVRTDGASGAGQAQRGGAHEGRAHEEPADYALSDAGHYVIGLDVSRGASGLTGLSGLSIDDMIAEEVGELGAMPVISRDVQKDPLLDFSMSGFTAEERDVALRFKDDFVRILEKNYFELFSLDRKAKAADIRKAYFALAKEYHTDKLQGLPEPIQLLGREIFNQIQRAYETLTDTEQRDKYVATTFYGKVDDEEAAIEEVQAVLAADQHYKTGIGLLNAGNLAGAHAAFERATDLYPKEPEYRACYGYTLFKLNYPSNSNAYEKGEKLIQDALRENPKLERGNVLLGRVYVAKENFDQAARYFVRALKLNGSNLEAGRELQQLRNRKDTQETGILSSLFSRFRK